MTIWSGWNQIAIYLFFCACAGGVGYAHVRAGVVLLSGWPRREKKYYVTLFCPPPQRARCWLLGLTRCRRCRSFCCVRPLILLWCPSLDSFSPFPSYLCPLSTGTKMMQQLAAKGGERKANVRLPPEVNRILYVRNLPFKITAEEMYDIFGKYGAIRQIRLGDKQDTKGTAFVVYEDIYDAKNAVDHLSGFNVCGRYLIVLYYQLKMAQKAQDNETKRKELDEARKRYGIERKPTVEV